MDKRTVGAIKGFPIANLIGQRLVKVAMDVKDASLRAVGKGDEHLNQEEGLSR